MTPTIQVPVLGILRQHPMFEEWWTAEPQPIPFFDGRELTIHLTEFVPGEDPELLAEAGQAFQSFLELKSSDRLALSPLVLRNCQDFLESVEPQDMDEQFRQPGQPEEIWNFVHPDEIYISRRPYGERDVYIQVTAECDWEEEHGLQLVFRQGRKLTRISSQDGHLTEADAYGKPDEEDELLSQF